MIKMAMILVVDVAVELQFMIYGDDFKHAA
jgi:hypothetical protein